MIACNHDLPSYITTKPLACDGYKNRYCTWNTKSTEKMISVQMKFPFCENKFNKEVPNLNNSRDFTGTALSFTWPEGTGKTAWEGLRLSVDTFLSTHKTRSCRQMVERRTEHSVLLTGLFELPSHKTWCRKRRVWERVWPERVKHKKSWPGRMDTNSAVSNGKYFWRH